MEDTSSQLLCKWAGGVPNAISSGMCTSSVRSTAEFHQGCGCLCIHPFSDWVGWRCQRSPSRAQTERI
uniref:Uncharacterized protein n=1 Tax=Mesocestoides corti TaxID=53468 RepID=A0A5K3FPK9_MESCO